MKSRWVKGQLLGEDSREKGVTIKSTRAGRAAADVGRAPCTIAQIVCGGAKWCTAVHGLKRGMHGAPLSAIAQSGLSEKHERNSIYLFNSVGRVCGGAGLFCG